MELRAPYPAPANHGRDLASIKSGTDDVRSIGRLEGVAVHEIKVCAVGERSEQRVPAPHVELVPAHVRDAPVAAQIAEERDLAGHEAQPYALSALVAAIGQELH